jgi:hypothetical protein
VKKLKHEIKWLLINNKTQSSSSFYELGSAPLIKMTEREIAPPLSMYDEW